MSISDEDEFPQILQDELQLHDPKKLKRLVKKQEKREKRAIDAVNRRSTLRYVWYLLFFVVLFIFLPPPLELWAIAKQDVNEIWDMMTTKRPVAEPIVVYPLRKIPLTMPIAYATPTNVESFDMVIASLHYWMNDQKPCLCAHHLVTDTKETRLCLVKATPTIVMWNMRLTGGMERSLDDDDDGDDTTMDEQSQFCPKKKKTNVQRRRSIYVTWQRLSDNSYHVNEFYGETARCLQIANEEMDANYSCD